MATTNGPGICRWHYEGGIWLVEDMCADGFECQEIFTPDVYRVDSLGTTTIEREGKTVRVKKLQIAAPKAAPGVFLDGEKVLHNLRKHPKTKELEDGRSSLEVPAKDGTIRRITFASASKDPVPNQFDMECIHA